MRVRIERRGPVDVIRYSEKHECTEEDDEQDRRVREYLEARIRDGQNLYLLGVRDLYVTFGSSLGALFNSWRPAYLANAQIALLWKPNDWKLIDPKDQRIDRWRSFVDDLGKIASQTGITPFMGEKEATASLLADEAGPA